MVRDDGFVLEPEGSFSTIDQRPGFDARVLKDHIASARKGQFSTVDRQPIFDPALLEGQEELIRAQLQNAMKLPVPWVDNDFDSVVLAVSKESNGLDRLTEADELAGTCPATTAQTDDLAAAPTPTATKPESALKGNVHVNLISGDALLSGNKTSAVKKPASYFASKVAEVVGDWVSEGGTCRVSEDTMTKRLYYEEPTGDGSRILGWLDNPVEEDGNVAWEAVLSLLEEGARPWYGPSFGEPPEPLGDIRVLLMPGEPATMETKIRILGEDEDWGNPVLWAQCGPKD
eukprot:TRINITY_DN76209_c0_g1_i1.p1 TRINITY_DN76209_c0_g1~~TRINITY_DN76209_c0_g1_i1.p1  ORF type:complete len:288 (-),score=61.34 TRINITY_DN76209_c0_g1_i1:172-1035(-)